jgi:hypothetical protein
MLNLMTDIETLGLERDAVIMQIAAIAYNDQYEVVSDFNSFVNIPAQMLHGATTTPSTITFWNKEIEQGRVDETRRSQLFNSDADPHKVAKRFSYWMVDQVPDQFIIWANHLLFDVSKLDNFMTTYGQKAFSEHTRYNKIEDLATLKYACNQINPELTKKMLDTMYKENAGTLHDGMDDCLFQMEIHKRYLNILKGGYVVPEAKE